MKKLLALLLILITVLSFVACEDNTETPSDDDKTLGTSQGGENNDNNNDQNNESNDNNNSDNSNNSSSSSDNSLTKEAMEAEIFKRLSAISPLKSLTLCGGSKITYTQDGFIMAGDWWVIEDPTMSKDEFMAAIDSQLTSAGFVKNPTFLGTEYTVKAGPGVIGISVMYDSDSSELTLRMTNHRDEYTSAFIAAENAKLPTIIEGVDIIEKLPKNFSVSFTTNAYKYTVCRYEGSYMVTHESLDQAESGMILTSYDVALSDGNGGYTYYDWYDILYVDRNEVKEVKPQLRDCFMSQTSNTLDEQLYKIMEPLSTWIRMSWEYKELPIDEERFFWSMTDYSISENMTKTGGEIFLGRACEKVHSEGLWADTYDIVFDLETGMVMKMTVQESGQGEFENYVEVTEYNTAPASLGKFVKP